MPRERTPVSEESRGRWLDALGLILLCGCAVLSGMLEVFFIPLYAGRALVPVVVIAAIVGNAVLPRLARWLIPATGAAVATFLCWLIPVLALSVTPRPEGDVLVRAGGGEQWVFYGVLLLGALVGVVTIVTGNRPPRPPLPPRPPRASISR